LAAGSVLLGADAAIAAPLPVTGVLLEDGSPVQGVQVTVTNQTTAESLNDTTDLEGAWDVDLENLPSGYSTGDIISVVPQTTAGTGIEALFAIDAPSYQINFDGLDLLAPPPHPHRHWVGDVELDVQSCSITATYRWPLIINPLVTNLSGRVEYYGDATLTHAKPDDFTFRAVSGLYMTGPGPNSMSHEDQYNPSNSTHTSNYTITVSIDPPSSPPAQEQYNSRLAIDIDKFKNSQWEFYWGAAVTIGNMQVTVGPTIPALTGMGLVGCAALLAGTGVLAFRRLHPKV